MEAFVNRQVQNMAEKLYFEQHLLIEDEPSKKEEDDIGEDVIRGAVG